MFIRKLIAGSAAATLVVSTWSLLALSPAHAEPASGHRADANDIVGVGSDTTQFAMQYIADGVTVNGVAHPGYNDLIAPNASDAQLVTYDAYSDAVVDDCPEASSGVRPDHPVAGRVVECLRLRTGGPLVWRPNGSGNGKRALYQAMTSPGADTTTTADDTTIGDSVSGNPAVNFARSSAPIQAGAEIGANLWAFPFAFDGFKPGVRAAGTNAPSTISAADFLKIYKGEVTNWNQIGGSNGVIKPLIPQPGSGTYQVFNTSMTSLNGGNAWNTNPNSAFAQEHDPTLVQNDPNAIAPFSTGRAKAFAASVRVLTGGWSVDRALFNVVRNADLGAAFVPTLFGTDGFLCSPAAQPLIEASGFEQLAPPALGGICGEPTQGTPSNFTTSPVRTTATTLAGTSPAAQTVKLTATIDRALEGSVQFFDADTKTLVGTGTVAARQASLSLGSVTPGVHRYTAKFNPSGAFSSSESAVVAVTVLAPVAAKAKVTLGESFPAKVKLGKKAKTATVKGTVTVKGGSAATGKVTVKKGKKSLASGSLKAGKAKIALKKLKPGTYKLTVSYAGDATHEASTKKFTVKVTKAKAKAKR